VVVVLGSLVLVSHRHGLHCPIVVPDSHLHCSLCYCLRLVPIWRVLVAIIVVITVVVAVVCCCCPIPVVIHPVSRGSQWWWGCAVNGIIL
jgi:hypothetical protein